MFLFNKFKQSKAERKFAAEVEQFRREVDFIVNYFELNPELPEIIRLKAEAEKALMGDGSSWRRMHLLRMLNPHAHVVHDRGVVILHERMLWHVLEIWSIARRQVYHLDEQLKSITVDGSGTHLHGKWGTLFTSRAGAINPHRFADPGNRYEIAFTIIKEFTGINVDDYWTHVGQTKTITVTRVSDEDWAIEFEPVGVNS